MSAKAVFTCDYPVKHWGTIWLPCNKRLVVDLGQEYYLYFNLPEPDAKGRSWHVDIEGNLIRCPSHAGMK